MRTLGRVGAIGLAWGALWVAAALALSVVVGVVDPDSIDPGEGPLVVAAVLGPMGFFSGVAFALLLSLGRTRGARLDPSFARATACGVLGSTLVQLAYLGHGDQGLAENAKMALLFCAFGGVVAMAWLVMARRWQLRGSSPQPSS